MIKNLIRVGDQRIRVGDRAIRDADLVFNHYYFNFTSRIKAFFILYERIIILFSKGIKKQVVARVARRYKVLATVSMMIYNKLKACCKSGKGIGLILKRKR